MSNKEALRELQQRLAERMQAARTQAIGHSWLAVECAAQGFLLPLQQAGEIFTPPAITPVPHTQPWLSGVANLRGGLFAVVDLAAFLGLRVAPAQRLEQGQLVVFNARLDINCALWVDRLAGLRNSDELEAVEAPGRRDDLPAFAGQQWRDRQGRLWQALKLDALAQDEHFLSIVA